VATATTVMSTQRSQSSHAGVSAGGKRRISSSIALVVRLLGAFASES
jgi:hypothetical protein